MFKTITRLIGAGVVLAAPVRADDAAPSAEEAAMIEAHASSWEVVLQRERLRVMAAEWRTLIATPDSAAACVDRMLPLAGAIVDRLTLSTGFSRGVLMRWVENDAGLDPYFFPPGPAEVRKGSGFWKLLTPVLPLLLVRVVDRVLDD